MNVQNVNIGGRMVKTVISIFAGCGGSSFGYKLAGFKELLAIDFNDNAEKTFKANFPEIPFLNADIKQISSREILNKINLKKGELDILDGSPPCQGFSTAGKRNINDSRNDLFKEFIRLIKELQPKIFVMENVYGMVKGKMKGRFLEILKTLEETNYNVKCKLLNAANYGVPQARQRLFFIGIRKDLNKQPIFPKLQNKIITLGEALKDLHLTKQDLIETEIKNPILLNGYDKIPKGRNGEAIKKGSYFNTIRQDERKPASTVTKTRGLLHYDEKRYLTIKEVKRLCSFPDDFKLFGTELNQWARLGNSVMPLQMKAIAEELSLLLSS